MNITMSGKIIAFSTLLLVLSGCGQGDGASTNGEGKDVLEARARIAAMEDSLFSSADYDARNAQALVDVYKRYAITFQRDTLVPEYLFRAAGVCRTMRDPEQSIMLYDRILADFPSWNKAPDALYLKAFVIDTDLGQKGEAKRAYQHVINNFPDHPFAQDARVMMEHADLSDEELIKRFQAKEQETAGQ